MKENETHADGFGPVILTIVTPDVPAPAVETPAVETSAVVTPVVETPAVETPAAPVVPEGYVKAEEVETERTARTAAETRAAEQEARATAAEARARSTEIRLAAQALGFNDPADAEKFVGADVEDVSAHLSEVIKTKSYLVKTAQAPVVPPVTPTVPTNPAREGAQLTAETLKGMTAAQVAALPWAEVSAALKR